jgi:hypothetical protein
LNELLLASQQRDAGKPATAHLEDIEDQVVVLHVADRDGTASSVFASTIATIQTNAFVRRVSWIFDIGIIAAAIALSTILRYFSRMDVFFGAVAFSAAYCLIALATVSHLRIWLPGWLPLAMIWLLAVFRMFLHDTVSPPVDIASPQPKRT